MKKALITGITGQDGSYLAQFLLKKGYRVFGLTRPGKKHYDNLDYLQITRRLNLQAIDLLDQKAVKNVLTRIKPDEIYHLASQSSVFESFRHPQATLQFNVLSLLTLLESVRNLNLKTKIYQASSSEMFGIVKNLPAREDTPLSPLSPYGLSKATEYWSALHYRDEHNLFCCSGILFNHESVLRGKQFATKKILAAAVRIYLGSKEKLSLGNIDVKRDWGYAPEYVKAMWLMLQQKKADDYILATNQAHSLKDFVVLVFKTLGLNWKDHVVIDKNLFRSSDLKVIYGDPGKAKKKLKWRYRLSFKELVSTLVKEEIEFQKHAQ